MQPTDGGPEEAGRVAGVVGGWRDLDAETQSAVEGALTVKQLDVWKLYLGGMSIHGIAYALDVSRASVKEHLTAAERRLRKAGVE